MRSTIKIRTKQGCSLEQFLQGGNMLMPIREITATNYGIKSTLSSLKNPTPQQAESSLEHDFLTLLEWDTRVGNYITQPLTFEWSDQHGKVRQYTPDVLVSYHSIALARNLALRATVFEVKPRYLLQKHWPELRLKFKAAISALRPVGIHFKIVTEKEIRTPLLDNARFLLRYKTWRFQNQTSEERLMVFEIRDALLQLGVTTPKALLNYLSNDDQRKILYIPWIWWLLNLGVIEANLNIPLSMASPIWTTDTKNSIPRRAK